MKLHKVGTARNGVAEPDRPLHAEVLIYLLCNDDWLPCEGFMSVSAAPGRPARKCEAIGEVLRSPTAFHRGHSSVTVPRIPTGAAGPLRHRRNQRHQATCSPISDREIRGAPSEHPNNEPKVSRQPMQHSCQVQQLDPYRSSPHSPGVRPITMPQGELLSAASRASDGVGGGSAAGM
jgi:hypothetical protein